jgi:hypothetical protein
MGRRSTPHIVSAKDRLLFMNAWYGWMEGVCLESDDKHDYACLNTASGLVFGLQLDELNAGESGR